MVNNLYASGNHIMGFCEILIHLSITTTTVGREGRQTFGELNLSNFTLSTSFPGLLSRVEITSQIGLGAKYDKQFIKILSF